jgi:predicted DCC family thiol-disulfide oxidoreductase YuxK
MSTHVYVYDGVCVLCSKAVQYILKHERHKLIQFVAIQSQEGQALALAHGVDPIKPETLLFIENGMAFTGSDGILRLLQHTGGPARLLLIGRIVPRAIRDVIYGFIARNRYRLFGKYNTCKVPSADVRHRFVLPESLS